MKKVLIFLFLMQPLYLVKAQLVSTILTERWEDDVWGNFTLESFGYDLDSNQRTDLFENWNPDVEEWRNNYQYTYKYNSNGSLDSSSYKLWFFTHWSEKSRVAHTYNSDDLLFDKIEYLPGGSEWDQKYRHAYSYDIFGNVLEELFQLWDDDEDEWYDYQREVFIYEDGLVIEKVKQNFTDTIWTNIQQVLLTYNTSNLVIKEENLNFGDSSWYFVDKIETIFDADLSVTNRIVFDWDLFHEDWEVISEEVFTYNENGTIHEILKNKLSVSTGDLETFERSSYTYTNTVGLDEQLNLVFTIYPNPTSDYISLSFEEEGEKELKILDLNGKLLYSLKDTGKDAHLDMRQLPNGIYTLSILKGQRSFSKKIVKK